MHRSVRDFRHFMDDFGLSASQVSTLMHLHYHGSCGVSEIGNHLGVTNAASSQMIDRLVQMNLINRSEDLTDRRVKQITLTPQGQKLVEGGIEARQRWMEELTTNLTQEQQEVIIDALTLLTEVARKLDKGKRQERDLP